MKKLLCLILGIVMSVGVLYAADTSSVNFLNKSYNLKYTKSFSKNSYMKIYVPKEQANSNYKSSVIKSYFTMQDAISDSIQDEINDATKDIVNKDVKTLSPVWSKMDVVNESLYIISSCYSIDSASLKVACTYNSSKYFNNNTEISMFSYSTFYTVADNSNIKSSMDKEYANLKNSLINVHSK